MIKTYIQRLLNESKSNSEIQSSAEKISQSSAEAKYGEYYLEENFMYSPELTKIAEGIGFEEDYHAPEGAYQYYDNKTGIGFAFSVCKNKSKDGNMLFTMSWDGLEDSGEFFAEVKSLKEGAKIIKQKRDEIINKVNKEKSTNKETKSEAIIEDEVYGMKKYSVNSESLKLGNLNKLSYEEVLKRVGKENIEAVEYLYQMVEDYSSSIYEIPTFKILLRDWEDSGDLKKLNSLVKLLNMETGSNVKVNINPNVKQENKYKSINKETKSEAKGSLAKLANLPTVPVTMKDLIEKHNLDPNASVDDIVNAAKAEYDQFIKDIKLYVKEKTGYEIKQPFDIKITKTKVTNGIGEPVYNKIQGGIWNILITKNGKPYTYVKDKESLADFIKDHRHLFESRINEAQDEVLLEAISKLKIYMHSHEDKLSNEDGYRLVEMISFLEGLA